MAQPPAPALLGSRPGVQLAVGMVLAALVVVAAVLLSALRRARAMGARAAARLTHAERSAATAGAPPAADLALLDLDGVPGRLSTLVSDGRPALLVLVGAHCALCDTLLPELEGWQASTDGPAHVVAVTSGEPQKGRAKVRGVPGLRGPGREVAEAYDVLGVPAAVLVTPELTLPRAVAHGPDEVRQARAALGADPPHVGVPPGSAPAVLAPRLPVELGSRRWAVAPDAVHVTDGDTAVLLRVNTAQCTALPGTAARGNSL